MLRSLCKTMWRFLKTLNYDVIKLFHFFLPRRTESRALKRYVNMHTRVHRGTFPVARRWKRPKCPWTGKQMNTMRSVPTVGNHPAFKSVHPPVCPSITHTYIVHTQYIHPCILSMCPSLHPSRREMFACSLSQWAPSAGSWSQGPPDAHHLTADKRPMMSKQLQVKAASGKSRSPTPTKAAGETFKGG